MKLLMAAAAACVAAAADVVACVAPGGLPSVAAGDGRSTSAKRSLPEVHHADRHQGEELRWHLRKVHHCSAAAADAKAQVGARVGAAPTAVANAQA